jgi:acyl carrier protein
MNDKVQELVIGVLREYGEADGIETLRHAYSETILFGANGTLDSLALVNVVADVETRVEEVFGEQITLADERAVSRRRSPFRSVESLAEYIEELLREK